MSTTSTEFDALKCGTFKVSERDDNPLNGIYILKTPNVVARNLENQGFLKASNYDGKLRWAGIKLGQLQDVELNSNLQNGNSLMFNIVTRKWENQDFNNVGLRNLNGLTDTSQTFVPTTNGSSFSITNDLISVHNFNIPSVSETTDGLLTPIDWAFFNTRINNYGEPSDIFIGNSSNEKQRRKFSGQVFLDSTGGAKINPTGPTGTLLFNSVDYPTGFQSNTNIRYDDVSNKLMVSSVISNFENPGFLIQAKDGTNLVFQAGASQQQNGGEINIDTSGEATDSPSPIIVKGKSIGLNTGKTGINISENGICMCFEENSQEKIRIVQSRYSNLIGPQKIQTYVFPNDFNGISLGSKFRIKNVTEDTTDIEYELEANNNQLYSARMDNVGNLDVIVDGWCPKYSFGNSQNINVYNGFYSSYFQLSPIRSYCIEATVNLLKVNNSTDYSDNVNYWGVNLKFEIGSLDTSGSSGEVFTPIVTVADSRPVYMGYKDKYTSVPISVVFRNNQTILSNCWLRLSFEIPSGVPSSGMYLLEDSDFLIFNIT